MASLKNRAWHRGSVVMRRAKVIVVRLWRERTQRTPEPMRMLQRGISFALPLAVERSIHWCRARDTGVAWLDGINY
jgi:hypothetical protein